jgi:hypothetical protein
MSRLLLRGDWVEVRSLAEILDTLDEDGRFDGLPFMPEMAAYCGRRLKVYRRADKTCAEGYGLRRLEGTVHLETARCDGAAHDGCQRNCLMFWKEAWLRPADGPGEGPLAAPDDFASSRLRTREGERYLCQSTVLGEASRPLPQWSLSHLASDVARGELSPAGLIAMAWRMLVNQARRRLGMADLGALTGPGQPRARTDAARLGLSAGERVRVRPAEDIRRTLGPNGKSAGLSFEPEMTRYVGADFEVEFRVERIIHEETGKMVRLADTVALKGLGCLGSCVKNCPRNNTLYWREAWLERA